MVQSRLSRSSALVRSYVALLVALLSAGLLVGSVDAATPTTQETIGVDAYMWVTACVFGEDGAEPCTTTQIQIMKHPVSATDTRVTICVSVDALELWGCSEVSDDVLSIRFRGDSGSVALEPVTVPLDALVCADDGSDCYQTFDRQITVSAVWASSEEPSTRFKAKETFQQDGCKVMVTREAAHWYYAYLTATVDGQPTELSDDGADFAISRTTQKTIC